MIHPVTIVYVNIYLDYETKRLKYNKPIGLNVNILSPIPPT